MTNNDIFKKLRVALQLRDDQIVEILELVDFRISKGEIGNFFRNEDHPKFVECGDQVLRNFLNALVIYLRGTKENPTNAMDILEANKANIKSNQTASQDKATSNFKKAPSTSKPFKPTQSGGFKKAKTDKNKPNIPNFAGIKFKNGKKKTD